MKNLTTVFKSRNLKLTPQRIAVYDILKNSKSHPSAETIYSAIKKQYPTMSLATVYKSLKTMVEVELVAELNVGEGNFRYDANLIPHPHIVCISCGRVDDIETDDFSMINETVKNHTDYDVLASRIYFYGICPNCKKNS